MNPRLFIGTYDVEGHQNWLAFVALNECDPVKEFKHAYQIEFSNSLNDSDIIHVGKLEVAHDYKEDDPYSVLVIRN